MELHVTPDAGRVADLRRLAGELAAAAPDFALRTAAVPGTLAVRLRCLPERHRRRTTARYHVAERTLNVDLTVTEEAFGGRSTPWQREELGRLLDARLRRSLATSTAPWTPGQRSDLREAVRAVLTALGWLDGARGRARRLVAEGRDLDEVARLTGLAAGEVRDLHAEEFDEG